MYNKLSRVGKQAPLFYLFFHDTANNHPPLQLLPVIRTPHISYYAVAYE
jgi:hypothetical protein